MKWSDFWYWFFDALAAIVAFVFVIFITFIIFAVCVAIIVYLIIGPWLLRLIVIVISILLGCGIYAYNMSK